jgi:ribosomal protein S18 acetylase RimI-like enzyme
LSSSEQRVGLLRGLSRTRHVQVRRLSARDRPLALEFLKLDERENLLLLDLAAEVGLGVGSLSLSPEIVGAWRDGELVGVASLRPTVAIDARLEDDVLDALAPYVASVPAGLLKSSQRVVDPVWSRLRNKGKRVLLDRMETAYAIDASEAPTTEPPEGAIVRRASDRDLEVLVLAARASLREEDRPDPFDGDPAGFRRWVRSRIHRARVVDIRGRVAFVAYADVRRAEGWLIQGVYTCPDQRRRGLAAAGMAAVVREAVASGATHVQLAVVDGNDAAIGLYRGLGFRPFSQLRTILFAS